MIEPGSRPGEGFDISGGTLLTLDTRAPPRHARESGHPERAIPCLELWTPAFAAVIQLRNLARLSSYLSFPRKREPRDFSRLPLGARVPGDDELVCSQDFLTASFAGVTEDGATGVFCLVRTTR